LGHSNHREPPAVTSGRPLAYAFNRQPGALRPPISAPSRRHSHGRSPWHSGFAAIL